MSEKKTYEYSKNFYQSMHVILEETSVEEPRISYLTAAGIIEGELAEIENIEIAKEEKNYKVRDLTLELIKRNEEMHEVVPNRDSLLHLKNVKLYPTSGYETIHNLGDFTLNIDQIIGVVAGSVKK